VAEAENGSYVKVGVNKHKGRIWMKRWLPLGIIGAMTALFAVTPLGGGFSSHIKVARAAQAFDVVVGTDIEADLIETNAFLPRAITISAGDTVNWRFGGFHTVTFPAGGPPPDFFTPGSGPGELQIGPGGFPIPLGPNPPGGPYDGSTLISSGTPQDDPAQAPPFTLTFTNPGVYQYLCLVHFGMAGQVTVLGGGTTLPETPSQVKTRGQDELHAATGLVISLAQGVNSAAAAGRAGVSGHAIAAGLNTPLGASNTAFLPDTVTVRRGDVLSFVNSDTFNPHTVTFVSGAPSPVFIDAVPSPNGPPQLIIRANVAGPTGGTSYAGQGYLNSGILLPGQTFSVSIDAPAGTYTYICLIHGSESGGMKGTINVTE
jgi:plastocyanin